MGEITINPLVIRLVSTLLTHGLKLNTFPPEVTSVRALLPTSPFVVGKTYF